LYIFIVWIFGFFCREILSERGIGVHVEDNHVEWNEFF
jgi:hypothetical protein